MKTSLYFLLASVALALPGLWLIVRHHARWSSLAAMFLLLLATASAYTSMRLWHENRTAPESTESFSLNAPAGQFQVVTPAQLPAALSASRGRPVLLEFYADWCSSCVVWKTTVFNRADVQAAMTPLVLLQIDASELSPEVQALLNAHQLAGLPAILVYDKNGQEQPALKLQGEMSAPDFMDWIKQRLLPLR